jgi:hypothetical protein
VSAKPQRIWAVEVTASATLLEMNLHAFIYTFPTRTKAVEFIRARSMQHDWKAVELSPLVKLKHRVGDRWTNSGNPWAAARNQEAAVMTVMRVLCDEALVMSDNCLWEVANLVAEGWVKTP